MFWLRICEVVVLLVRTVPLKYSNNNTRLQHHRRYARRMAAFVDSVIQLNWSRFTMAPPSYYGTNTSPSHSSFKTRTTVQQRGLPCTLSDKRPPSLHSKWFYHVSQLQHLLNENLSPLPHNYSRENLFFVSVIIGVVTLKVHLFISSALFAIRALIVRNLCRHTECLGYDWCCLRRVV